MDTKESPVGVIASWAALVASFVLSFATWVSLAELAGFTGEAHGFRLSWMMAVAVDGYVVSALVTWMAPVSDEIARFAKVNTYAGAGIGVVAQSAYHGLSASTDRGQWVPYLAAVVGALPPLAAGLSVHLRALVRRAHLSGQSAGVSVRAWTPAPDMSELDTDKPEPLTDADKVILSEPVPDTVPDMDALPSAPVSPAPVRTPRPRTPRTEPEWKATAREMIADGMADYEIARKILAEYPDNWSHTADPVESGRKAVSRLR